MMIGFIDRSYPKNGIHGRVVHEVGRAIVSGRFKEGDRLPKEEFFIERYSGSRTAIREAFRVLTAKGLLEAKQRAGTSVRIRQYWNFWDPDVLAWQRVENITQCHAIQMMQIRLMVEPEAARLQAKRAGEFGGLRILEKTCQMMLRAWEERSYIKTQEAQLAFHSHLVENCGNEYLIRARDLIRLSIKHSHYHQFSFGDSRTGSARAYESVVEKIKDRDPEGAYKGVKALSQQYAEFLVSEKERALASKNAVA